MTMRSGFGTLGLAVLAVLGCISVPTGAGAQTIAAVNAAEAQSLAQNNAFNLNVGIQDFPPQLNVILTNLTEGTREVIARETKDTVYRVFLQQHIVDPFEQVRDDLRTAAEDLTRASVNFQVATVVNVVITQFNKVWKLIYSQVFFRGHYYYRSKFLSAAAIYEFKALLYQLQKVIDIHKYAVAQAK